MRTKHYPFHVIGITPKSRVKLFVHRIDIVLYAAYVVIQYVRV